MTEKFTRIFGGTKWVIAMDHSPALPGAPLFNTAGGIEGIEGIVEAAAMDREALQAAGFDAVMFDSENDRPCELQVGVHARAQPLGVRIARDLDDARGA